MFKLSVPNSRGLIKRFFKKINAPYRLSLVNEETLEESMVLHLTKKYMYIFLSMVLVLMFLLFSLLFLFTPLRLYIPNSGQEVTRRELLQIRKLSDSLLVLNEQREHFIQNLLQVAGSNTALLRDTQRLNPKLIEAANQQNNRLIDRASRYDYLKAMVADSNAGRQDTVKKKVKINRKN